VITSQREQYEGTVHLFIGTGHNPDKITFVSLITNHNHNTNYQRLCGLFLFKSVPSFVLSMPSCRSSFNCSVGIYLHVISACISSCRRCFCLEQLRRRRRPPTCTGCLLLFLQGHIYGSKGRNIDIFAEDSSLAINSQYTRSSLDLLSQTPRFASLCRKLIPS
jgi:hypothetical protein